MIRDFAIFQIHPAVFGELWDPTFQNISKGYSGVPSVFIYHYQANYTIYNCAIPCPGIRRRWPSCTQETSDAARPI